MNKDAEAINQFLAWLLQEPTPAVMPSGKLANPFADLEQSGAVNLQPYMDPLDSEVEAMQAELSESSAVFTEDTSSLKIGEIPAVQDRFHAIIKRRLRAEIERNPPLFPWETSLMDYESESAEMIADAVPISFWNSQLEALKLPVQLPEELLLRIFDQCRQLVHSSLREGVKLVRAVETLFPDEPQALNHWAGQVLAEPVRGAHQALDPATLPPSYEAANPTQQMVLSLLAAQQVLAAMTLEVSTENPQVQRLWLTTAGPLVLDVTYSAETNGLQIQGQLPTAGRLAIKGSAGVVTATCSTAASLSVELTELTIGQTYPLEVTVEGAEPSTLGFAIHLSQGDL